MAEYIDRDAFLTQERAWYCDNCDRRKNSKGKTVYEIGEAPCRACYIGDVLDALEDYPAADVVERKTGKWINYLEDGFVECPFCKSATNCDGDIAELHYCFNCGAKLEGDEDV